jgi:hypothetical protein
MKKNTLLIFFINSFFYMSCFSAQQHNSESAGEKDYVVANLNAWVGRPVSELLTHSKFGTPDDKVTVGGDTVVTYRQLFNAKRGVNERLKVNIFCRRKFIYGSNNIIKSVQEEGTCQDTQTYLPRDYKTK